LFFLGEISPLGDKDERRIWIPKKKIEGKNGSKLSYLYHSFMSAKYNKLKKNSTFLFDM
jgi:hypothetical protein